MAEPSFPTSTLVSEHKLTAQIVVAALGRLLINTGRRMPYPFAPALSRGLGVSLTAITSLIAINQIISKRALVGWTTIEHTGVDIPVYAYGPHSDLFQGLLDNTALPKLMAEAMQIPFPVKGD